MRSKRPTRPRMTCSDSLGLIFVPFLCCTIPGVAFSGFAKLLSSLSLLLLRCIKSVCGFELRLYCLSRRLLNRWALRWLRFAWFFFWQVWLSKNPTSYIVGGEQFVQKYIPFLLVFFLSCSFQQAFCMKHLNRNGCSVWELFFLSFVRFCLRLTFPDSILREQRFAFWGELMFERGRSK